MGGRGSRSKPAAGPGFGAPKVETGTGGGPGGETTGEAAAAANTDVDRKVLDRATFDADTWEGVVERRLANKDSPRQALKNMKDAVGFMKWEANVQRSNARTAAKNGDGAKAKAATAMAGRLDAAFTRYQARYQALADRVKAERAKR